MNAALKKIVYRIDDNYVILPPEIEAENIDDNIKNIFDNPSVSFIRKTGKLAGAKRNWSNSHIRDFIPKHHNFPRQLQINRWSLKIIFIGTIFYIMM